MICNYLKYVIFVIVICIIFIKIGNSCTPVIYTCTVYHKNKLRVKTLSQYYAVWLYYIIERTKFQELKYMEKSKQPKPLPKLS